MIKDLNHIAYLGPQGSYTHTALVSNFNCKESKGLENIYQVFESVRSSEVELGCIPLENMLEGPVAETFDGLLSARGEIVIVDSFTFEIEHCLGVLPNSNASQITTVFSHPQALRQCSNYLDSELPKSKKISCTSTSVAASRVATDNDMGSAAIASAKTLEDSGLEILKRGIANTTKNKTRFALICRAENADSLNPNIAATKYTTSVAVDPGRDRQGILHEILQVVSVENQCNITSIHSRPDQRGGFVFFLDLEGHLSSKQVCGALDGLREYCTHTTSETATISCFGSYRVEEFHQRPFNKIGIIGCQGAMGRWLQDFFSSLAIETIGYDLGGETELKEVVSVSDVIILSIPMSEVDSLSQSIAPLVRPGQLVVENASIKSSSLPFLEKSLPGDVELLGIHTMFGESTKNIRDQNIIITRTNTSGEKAQAFEDLLYKQGARLSGASVEEHDKASASLQALIHMLLISTAGVLEAEWGTVDKLDSYTTPNARPLLAAMKRLLRQSDSLIFEMQTLNPQSELIRHKILSELCKQVFSIDQGDTTKLSATLERARKFFEENENSVNTKT